MLPLLGRAEETRLAYVIEAGLAATAALRGDGISADATRRELEQIEADGRRAWERFLLSNLRLVLSVSGPVARRSGVPEDVLFQEGVWALAHALRSFDPRVARFTTHAFQRVRGHVAAIAASRDGAVGLSPRNAVVLRRAMAITARIEAASGRPAPVDEVAGQLGRSTVWTARLLAHRQPVLAGGASDGRSPFRTTEPTEEWGLDDIDVPLQRLSGSQRQVLAVRYGFADGRPHSYREVSEILGLSTSDARRTCEAALVLLRQALARDSEKPQTTELSPAARRVLSEIDRLTGKGLSLLEVAIAMKTEPKVVYDACRVSGRDDLLARLTRMELRMTGPQPSGTNVLAQTIRRAAASRGRGSDRTRPRAPAGGSYRHVERPVVQPRSSPAPSAPRL